MFTIYIIYTKQQAARPEREKTMDVNSTISALNKITADVKQLSDSMSSATDPEQITPDQLKQALNILTYCWVNMDGEQFEAAMDPEKKTINYWLGKFRIMQRDGWSALWCNVDPTARTNTPKQLLNIITNRKRVNNMELIIIASFIIIGCLAHWAIFLYKVAITIEQSGLNFLLALC